jgi:hypothetical protein
VTGFFEGCHEHSRFLLAEMFSYARGFGLHGVIRVISVSAVGHNICSAVLFLGCITVCGISVSSEFESGTGQNINIYTKFCTVFK